METWSEKPMPAREGKTALCMCLWIVVWIAYVAMMCAAAWLVWRGVAETRWETGGWYGRSFIEPPGI